MLHRYMTSALASLIALQTACAPLEGSHARIADQRALERIARVVRTEPRLAACGDLRLVDFRRLSQAARDRTEPTEDAWRADDVGHAATRGPYGAFSAPADAQVVLTMLAEATGHQMIRTTTSSVVWQGADGVWQVNAVHNMTGAAPTPPRPPGEPPYTPEDLERMQRRIVVGVLAAEQAAILDGAMGDVCLELQPNRVPMDIPLLGGGNDFCYGGTGGVLHILSGGRRRTIVDSCARYVGGRIMHVVMYPKTAPLERPSPDR